MSCGSTRNYEFILSDDGVRGVSAEDEQVVVLVEEKLPEDEIKSGKLARERIDADTDVVEVNDVSALGNDVRARLESPRRRYRPVRPGVSEMNASGGAATAGFMARVTDPSAAEIGLNADAGQVVRVSNQHVYGRSENAEVGEPIVQPSPIDGDSDGTVGEYVGGSLLEDGSPADAAARSVSESERRSQRAYLPHGVGPMQAGGSVMRGDSVQKTGRTTGLTDGRVTATNATVDVSYGDAHENVRRRDVLVTTAQSKGGDSGAPLLTNPDSGRPSLIGHVFSGSQRVSIADKLGNIEEQLGVTALAAPERGDMPNEPGDPGESPDDSPEGDEPDDGGEGDDDAPGDMRPPSDRALINQVARAFEERYGSDKVLIEPRLKSGREPDVVVDTNLGVLMIEAEDDAESVLRESVSQALLYAGHSQDAIGMVVYPEGLDVPQPELGFLRAQSQVPFRAFPGDFPAF
jgi:hypothetical protein